MNALSASASPRDRPFDGFRFASGDAARILVQTVLTEFQTYEATQGTRKRKRRASAQALLERSVDAIISDLLHAHMERHGPRRVMVSLSKNRIGARNRYRSPVENDSFPQLLETLDAIAWLSFSRGASARWAKAEDAAKPTRSSRSTIEPGAKLLAAITDQEVTISDLSRHRSGETIVLRGEKLRRDIKGSLLNYDETAATRATRQQMERLNAWLESLDLKYAGDGVNTDDRFMRRIFNNGRFDHGGRLWGGFWQDSLKRSERGPLRINGERVAVVDYSGCFLRLLYALEGVEPAPGDLYALPSMPDVAREGVKTLCSSMLFRSNLPRRCTSDLRAELQSRRPLVEIGQAVRERHAAIAKHLPSTIGYRLFHLESEILLDVLAECETRSIPALPLHDAVITQASASDEVRAIMQVCFKGRMGITAPVSITLPSTLPDTLTQPFYNPLPNY